MMGLTIYWPCIFTFVCTMKELSCLTARARSIYHGNESASLVHSFPEAVQGNQHK
jgi:hypothetical protein